MLSDSGFRPSGTPFGLARYETPYEVGRTGIIDGLIPFSNNNDAIDIACGPGYFCKRLTDKGWRTTALDADSENLRSAAGHAAETHLGDAAVVLSKLPEGRYDLALALEIVEHLPKTSGADFLKAIRRVLKPGGRLIVSTPNRCSPEGWGHYYWGEKIRGWGKWYAWDETHVHIYSSHEFLRLLTATRFTVDRVTGYHYQGVLPLIGRWRMPITKSTTFPLNRLGFNTILECHK